MTHTLPANAPAAVPRRSERGRRFVVERCGPGRDNASGVRLHGGERPLIPIYLPMPLAVGQSNMAFSASGQAVAGVVNPWPAPATSCMVTSVSPAACRLATNLRLSATGAVLSFAPWTTMSGGTSLRIGHGVHLLGSSSEWLASAHRFGTRSGGRQIVGTPPRVPPFRCTHRPKCSSASRRDSRR